MTKQLTFIASGGRTGTQYFGEVLRKVVSDCHSEHEPDMVAGLSWQTLQRVRRFGLWQMGPGRLLGQTGVRVLGQAFLEQRIDLQTCAKRLRNTRNQYHALIPESLVVESYSAWWMVADHIGQIWPGAKLAGILRDPRDWIASWLKHGPKRRNGALTERLPPGLLDPGKIGDDYGAAQWENLDQIGRLAWEWGVIADTLDRAADQSKDVAVFRFEDLFDPHSEALPRFIEFVVSHDAGPRHEIGDLAAVRGDVRNASSGPDRGWRTWNNAQIAAVTRFCGRGMAAHGYGGEPEWRQRVKTALGR